MKPNEERVDMEVPDASKPREFLQNLKHIVVAVVDDTGKPWAVPVAVQKYEAGAIEWFSKTHTVHSKAIAENPDVMLTAFTPKSSEAGEFGIYLRARAKKILTLPGIGRYRAQIYEAWYTDEGHKKNNINIQDL